MRPVLEGRWRPLGRTVVLPLAVLTVLTRLEDVSMLVRMLLPSVPPVLVG
jgi:hypothetical protein